VDASRSLEQSFQDAEPEVKQAVAVATTSLRAGNYTEMARAMDPVLSNGRQLTPAQKQAVEQLFQQINQTLESDPSRDSKELYELRVKLHRAATGGRRF
jgi:membrane-associated HD superfamily phosphohydrolase